MKATKKINVTPKTPKKAAKKSSKIKPARILFVLDRSGSMSNRKNDAIGGYNSFLADQKKLKAKTRVTLAQFDNIYEVVHDNVDIQEIPDLTSKTFEPRGSTALYDAIGRTVNLHRATAQNDELTILVVITDGEENSSREFSHAAVQALLKDVQDNLGWEVMFLGSNIDAQAVGGSMGIKLSNTMTHDSSAKGMLDSYITMNYAASNMRGFSDEKLTAQFTAAGALGADGSLDAQALYNAVKAGTIKVEPTAKANKSPKA